MPHGIPARTRPDLNPGARAMRALIVGGSIAGLSAAHGLRRCGFHTVVLERSDGALLDRGAGLGLDLARLQAVLGRADGLLPPCIALEGRAIHTPAPAGHSPARAWRTRREPGRHTVSSWQHLYEALRAPLGPVVQPGVQVVGIARHRGGWRATTQDGRVMEADLLVGADGHGSVVRRHVDPQAVPRYAGYLLWRGLVDAHAAGDEARAQFLDGRLHLFAQPGHHMVVYEVPPARPGGARRLNWGWYTAASPAQQAALLQRAGLAPHTLIVPPARLPAADRHALVSRAAAWAAPWAALVARTADAGGLFVNAIHEFVSMTQPDAPVVLLGDAAHLLSPITGSGAAMAMEDALTLEHWSSHNSTAGGSAQHHWRSLARAMAESGRAAQQALLQARHWASHALGVPLPNDEAVPVSEEKP